MDVLYQLSYNSIKSILLKERMFAGDLFFVGSGLNDNTITIVASYIKHFLEFRVDPFITMEVLYQLSYNSKIK